MKRILLSLTMLLVSCASPEPARLAIPQSPHFPERGKDLVQGLAACGYCHGATPSPDAPPSGGRPAYDRYGEVLAPNITTDPSGVGGWSVNDMMAAIRSAKGRGGRLQSVEAHAGYEWLSDNDTFSILAYLNSLPPVKNDVHRRTVWWWSRMTTGFWEKRLYVAGFVPDLDPRQAVPYGEYLVDHVARYGRCHDGPAGIFHGRRHLAGGSPVKVGEEQLTAPSIAGGDGGTLAAWKAEDIVRYLQTGITKEGRAVNAAFCPVNFYRNASLHELQAVAEYLKTVKAE